MNPNRYDDEPVDPPMNATDLRDALVAMVLAWAAVFITVLLTLEALQ